MNTKTNTNVLAHKYILGLPLLLSGALFVNHTGIFWFALFIFIAAALLLNVVSYYSDLKRNFSVMTGFYIYNIISALLSILYHFKQISFGVAYMLFIIVLISHLTNSWGAIRSIAEEKAKVPKN